MHNKISTGAGAIVFVVIAITIGIFVWKYDETQQTTEQEKMTYAVKKPIDGNVYRNRTYNFEFEVPPNLTITPDSTDSITTINDGKGGHWLYSVNSMINLNNLSLKDALSQILEKPQYKEKSVIVSDTTLNNKPAKKFINKDAHDYGNVGIILLIGKNIVAITGDDSTPTLKKNFETFLETFRFTE